jgi:hypothetical protein
MANAQLVPTAEQRWKGLYQLGGWAAIASEVILILGIVTFFIWPYAPGRLSTQEIFEFLQSNPLGGLVALDLFLVLGNLLWIFLLLAFYISLRPVSEAAALVAVTLGLIAVAMIVPARPIIEMFNLSELYAAAATETARSHYLTAGEALVAIFDGTAWVFNMLVGGSAMILNSVLMLRNPAFGKGTAWVGIVTNLAVFLFFLPGGVGMLLLFLSLPGYMVWYAQLARTFFQMAHHS